MLIHVRNPKAPRMWVEREKEEGKEPSSHKAAMICFFPKFDIPQFAQKVFLFLFLLLFFIFISFVIYCILKKE